MFRAGWAGELGGHPGWWSLYDHPAGWSDEWQKLVDEMAEEDEDVQEYIRNLEERDDAGEMREASGDAIAKEFERYLRRRDRGGPPGSM